MNTNNASEPDWPTLVLDKSFMESLDRMAKRRFGQDASAEECASYVLECLSENEWQKCRQFQGRSKPSTFLVSVSNNLIEEFSRKRYGRPRPPVWLKEQGDLWVKLWRTVCLERQLVPSVVERFCRDGIRTMDKVNSVIRVIKARIPNCGIAGVGTCDTQDGDIESLSDLLGEGVQYQSAELFKHEKQVRKAFVSMIKSILSEHSEEGVCLRDNHRNQDVKVSEALLRLKDLLRFSDEEVLLLRL